MFSPQDSGKIRGKHQYEELSTQKQGVFFTTKALREQSNRYADLAGQYDSKQSVIVREVIDVCGAVFFFFVPSSFL